MFFQKKYDLIAIGDTVTDAFIKLKEAHINCKVNTEECEICMKFADKIPYESVEICAAVGNSPNAAVSASRLGISTAIVTDIGDDINGIVAKGEFEKNFVGVDFVKKHKGMKTNYHYVLWYEADRTILIKHEKYPYSLPNFREPKWIYLSSLGEHSLEFHKEIENYLITHPNVKLAFQPGTFQMRFGVEALQKIYARTEIFFCNKEEAERILGINETNIRVLAERIKALGPKIVCITDGPNGAYTFYNGDLYFMKPYPDPKPPFERTGAGDAFASTFASAIILGKSVEEALLLAPINSMAVVQEVGAQKGLLSQEKLLEWLSKAPSDYKPIKV